MLRRYCALVSECFSNWCRSPGSMAPPPAQAMSGQQRSWPDGAAQQLARSGQPGMAAMLDQFDAQCTGDKQMREWFSGSGGQPGVLYSSRWTMDLSFHHSAPPGHLTMMHRKAYLQQRMVYALSCMFERAINARSCQCSIFTSRHLNVIDEEQKTK